MTKNDINNLLNYNNEKYNYLKILYVKCVFFANFMYIYNTFCEVISYFFMRAYVHIFNEGKMLK